MPPPQQAPQGEHDIYRKTPEYLVEAHPERCFGPDPHVPPAVIGDWDTDDDWHEPRWPST